MKAIAMKCTQEQFESVKSKVNHATITKFEDCPFLTNNWVDSKKVSNITEEFVRKYKSEFQIHETWNEKIFLEACGIKVMKKPTLEEVKKHFENAKEVVSIYGSKRDIITPCNECIHEWKNGFWFGAGCKLWDEEKGFAKILTTKEKTFTITAGQLRQLTDPKLKEWFPEVFKVKLEVGKWYKYIGLKSGCFGFKGIGMFTDEEIESGFGLDDDLGAISLKSVDGRVWGVLADRFEEATEQEVLEALKNEADKKGYKKGNYKCLVINDFSQYEAFEICYDLNNDTLWLENGVVYKNGVWAKIIPTCTREEAEKLLNKKIID